VPHYLAILLQNVSEDYDFWEIKRIFQLLVACDKGERFEKMADPTVSFRGYEEQKNLPTVFHGFALTMNN
jgi:hypothetical protein